jgi:hypothetical protein
MSSKMKAFVEVGLKKVLTIEGAHFGVTVRGALDVLVGQY